MPRESKNADQALARVLRRLREEAGESQESLAYRAKLTSGSLAHLSWGSQARSGRRCAGSPTPWA